MTIPGHEERSLSRDAWRAALLSGVGAMILLMMRPGALWPPGVVVALVGPACVALAVTAPRFRLTAYIAGGLAACVAATMVGGLGLALLDSSGTRYLRLFLQNIIWNGSVVLFLGMVGVALLSVPLAIRGSPPWRSDGWTQVRLVAGVLAAALLSYAWLPTTENQGILVAMVTIGALGGVISGSWWSLTLLPLAMVGSGWLWFLLHPPPAPPHEPLSVDTMVIIWVIYAGAVAAGAAAGTLVATLVAVRLTRRDR